MTPSDIIRERSVTAIVLALCLVSAALGWVAALTPMPTWDIDTELSRAYGEIE